MAFLIRGEFPDATRHPDIGRFYLDCDQAMNPYTWKAPINWWGTINGVDVKFVQTSSSGSNSMDYDFSTLPERCRKAIPYIVKAIDDEMRVMD